MPPQTPCKNILLSHILRKIKNKYYCQMSIISLLVMIPAVILITCCDITLASFLIYCIFSNLIIWCPVPSCCVVPPQETKVWIRSCKNIKMICVLQLCTLLVHRSAKTTYQAAQPMEKTTARTCPHGPSLTARCSVATVVSCCTRYSS